MKRQANGIQIGYDILGKAGHPIVLIHGLGLDRMIWLEMAEQYLQDHRVLLMDIRGHGESDAPEGIYTMSLLADDLAALLEILGIGKAVVCGHSMGGYITLAFAAQYPDRIAGLGLITTRAEADPLKKQKGRYAMVEALEKRGSIALAESLAPRLARNPQIVQQAYGLILKNPSQGLIGAVKGLAERPDRTALLSDICVPTLVVVGEEDQIIRPAVSRRMASAFPNGQLLSLPEAGHMPMLESPEVLGLGLVGLMDQAASA